nr:hypothetical protein [Micromonospora sp. DSM 115978]
AGGRRRHHQLRDAQQRPTPLAGRVPLLLGGGGRKLTMPLVARHADWWNCPTYALADLDALRPLAGSVRVSTQHPVGLAASAATLDEVSAVSQKRFGGWGGLVTGTPDVVAEHFTTLARSGIERFYLQFTDFGTAETIKLFAREVIPALPTTAR